MSHPDYKSSGPSFEEFVEAQIRRQDRLISRTVGPLRRRERSLLARVKGVDTLIPTSPNHLLEALVSPYFEVRVNAGINRLRLHGAEARIITLTNEAELVFLPLGLGTPSPKTFRDVRVLETNNAQASEPSISGRWADSHDIRSYRIMADFHFHPLEGGFSGGDIEGYDSTSTNRLPLKYKIDHTFGVFIPRWHQTHQESETPTLEQAVELSILRLLMFSGPPAGTGYQDERFARLAVEGQADLLRQSGMRVNLVDLPTKDDKVDLTPLETTLR